MVWVEWKLLVYQLHIVILDLMLWVSTRYFPTLLLSISSANVWVVNFPKCLSIVTVLFSISLLLFNLIFNCLIVTITLASHEALCTAVSPISIPLFPVQCCSSQFTHTFVRWLKSSLSQVELERGMRVLLIRETDTMSFLLLPCQIATGFKQHFAIFKFYRRLM